MRVALPSRSALLAVLTASILAFVSDRTVRAQQAPPSGGMPSGPFAANLAAPTGGTCLDAPGAANTNGLALTSTACTSMPEQVFSFVPTGVGQSLAIHAPGAYTLCVDVADSGAVVQYYCVPTASQQWTPTVNPDGSYLLVNGQNGQCLSPSATGLVTAACAAGAATEEWSMTGSQSFSQPAAPTKQIAPITPVPNGGAGIWQAAYFHGLPYRILFPQGYDPAHYKYTMLTFLHGQGESGTDNTSQLINDMAYLGSYPLFGQYVPVILVAPQCPTTDTWGVATNSAATVTETAMVELTQTLAATLPGVDQSRIGLTGLSEGGIGTWDAINRFPGVFTFAAPIAGAGLPTEAPNLVNMPIVAVHGGDDPLIPASYDEQMYAAIQALGGTKMIYVELAGAGHGVWDATYTYYPFWIWVMTGIDVDA